ncbi:MAG TPA: hypothetical protein VKB57_25595 [Acidimicrobiales bacterium]|nr:hypothetical protein [Acidimicrobiales bacterium]
MAVVLTGALPAAAPAPVSAAVAPARAAAAPDVTAAVPALQQAFGPRYGGYWIDGRPGAERVHVQVVAATAADRDRVRALTGGRPRVVTDSVARGYDALVAAKDEVAAALAAKGQPFAVDVDVRRNAVVVQTPGDAAPAAALARPAARRGAGRVRHAATAPAADMAAAVAVEPHAAIAVRPLDTRNTFPPYEAGKGITIAAGSARIRCTTGFQFHNGFGMFGTTAGHCDHIGNGVAIGNVIVDAVRMNGYQGRSTVTADVSAYSLSGNHWAYRAVVHVQGGHRRVVGRYTNAQITNGMQLCFEGITSDGQNCGTVVRTNSSICCDAAHHTFVFSCINFPSRPGDSGSPVFARGANLTAVAAGALSSNVTINGQVLMCFSTIQNLEAFVGKLVTG